MTREMRFGEDAGNEIIKTVRETNRRMRNAEPYRGRWFNRSGRGQSECQYSYDLRIYWNPQAGNVTVGLTYNGELESFNIPYNASSDDIETLLNAHAELVAASATVWVASTGDLPNANQIIHVPTGATISQGSHTLVRRPSSPTPEYRLDTCCAG